MSSNSNSNDLKTTVMPKEHSASHQQSQGLPGVQIPSGDQLKVFEQEINKADAKDLNERIDAAKEGLAKK